MERSIESICEGLAEFHGSCDVLLDRVVRLIDETLSRGRRVATVGELATLQGLAEHLARDLSEVRHAHATGEVLSLPARDLLAHDDPALAADRVFGAFVKDGDLLLLLSSRRDLGYLQRGFRSAASSGANLVVIGPYDGGGGEGVDVVHLPVESTNPHQRIETQLFAIHEIVARASVGGGVGGGVTP